MKKLIYIGKIVFLSGYLISCSENFLDTIATDQYNEANWWQTENQAISSLNGIYQVTRNSDIGGANRLREESFSPNAYHSTISSVAEGIMTPGNDPRFMSCWRANYRGIGRANNFLDNVDRPAMDESLRLRIKGEAYFLRALFYFNLVTYYGGVPLILESPNLERHRDMSRNSRGEVINQVLIDLDEAASYLPLSYSGSDVGRATKGAALALKTKVLLYENRWSESASVAKEVMELGVYSLFPDYRRLFMLENQNNEEVIFDVQYKEPEYFTPFDVNLEEQGTNNPTLNLVNSYLMIDGLSMNESPLYDPEQPFENRDPRMHQTIVIPGYMYKGRIVPKSHYYGTGFGQKKYTTYEDDVPMSQVTRTDLNFILLRYADVLLMYAEAQNEASGPDDSVYDALNQIRIRAGMPNIIDVLTQDQLRNIIRHERRIELACEAQYYHDIRRWRIAEVVNSGQVLNIDSEPVQTRIFPPRNYLWPIHEILIQENPALEQNPGY